nr:MAG TPA: hypothetical protein [Caudoviricetes sp.]
MWRSETNTLKSLPGMMTPAGQASPLSPPPLALPRRHPRPVGDEAALERPQSDSGRHYSVRYGRRPGSAVAGTLRQ